MTITVTYRGIEFDLVGEYQPGYEGRMYTSNGDPGEPGVAAGFEDYDILHCGESVFDVLSQSAIEHIEALALKEVRRAA